MDEDSHNAVAVTLRFLRRLVIAGLAAIAILVLAGRVNATAVRFNAGDYVDREWYYLLDDGQYYYLDRGQYNLLGGLSYQLGHPCYPKLFERDSEQTVGFTNRINASWFSGRYFNAGDYIDKVQYYYLDKGQYYYLDREQYNWLGGLGYMFERPSYQTRYDWSYYQSVGQCSVPEPSTIGFLGLGAVVVLATRRIFLKSTPLKIICVSAF